MAPPSVLIADDDPGVRGMFRSLALREGYRLLEAESPQEAMEIAFQERPDILLLDLHFPGWPQDKNLLREVREALPAEDRPDIFAISGVYKTLQDKLQVFCSGADGYFAKPVSLYTVKDAIQAVRAGAIRAAPPLGRPSAGAARGAAVLAEEPRRPLVLLVDDDTEVRSCLGRYFGQAGFETREASCGEIALVMAHKLRPDAVVLDLKLPDMDGEEVGIILKGSPRTAAIPVLVLTSRERPGQEMACMDGLKLDAYLPKPGHDWEAIPAHVRRLLRPGVSSAHGCLSIGIVTLDLDHAAVYVDGEAVRLPPKEFELLAYLARPSPEVIPWKEIEREVWGWDPSRLSPKEPGTVRTTLNSLKKALGPKAAAYFRICRGVGVQFRRP